LSNGLGKNDSMVLLKKKGLGKAILWLSSPFRVLSEAIISLQIH